MVGFKPDIKTKQYSLKDDDCFAFVPFCCQQQLKGGLPRVGFVFLCEVEDGDLKPAEREVKNIEWMEKSKLKRIVNETPEKIFTLQLGVLDYYLNYAEEPVLFPNRVQ